MMDRRQLVALLGGATLAWPLELHGQQPGRIYRLGFLSSLGDNPPYLALFNELRRLGFIEHQNLTINSRGFGLRGDRFAEVAAELVKAPVDVVVAAGDVAIRAAQGATAIIPILGSADDMVGSGLVASMADPGGNTTGTRIFSTELDSKR